MTWPPGGNWSEVGYELVHPHSGAIWQFWLILDMHMT